MTRADAELLLDQFEADAHEVQQSYSLGYDVGRELRDRYAKACETILAALMAHREEPR